MKLKKLFAVFISAVLVVSAVPSNAALISSGYATRGEVVEMLLSAADDYRPDVQKTDIIKGYEDGQLHEENPVTRAEALIMLNRAFGGFPALKGDALRLAIPKEDFTDIPQWATAELTDVFQAGIVAGTGEGKFSPGDYVTKEQMELFINRTFILFGTNLKDSFYSTVNREYLNASQIPEGKTITGNLYDVTDTVTEQVRSLIEEISASEPEPGSAQDKIKILYDNIMDMDARNALGYEPIKEDIARAEKIESISALSSTPIVNASALSVVASFTLTVDPMDSNSYITYFSTASPSLVQQAYNGEMDYAKDAFLKYVTKLLTLCGETEAVAQADAQAFYDFEKQISDASLSPAEQNDLEKVYNLYTLDELQEVFPTVDLNALFEESGLSGKDKIMVDDVGKMEQVAALLTDDNLDAVKNYVKVGIIGSCAAYLGEDFRNATQTFQQEMLGVTGSTPLEDEAITIVSSVMPDYIGEAYADKYCTDEVIADVTGLISEIISVYRQRIENLDWMSDATKEKALLKLDTMRINVGAPEEFEPTLESADLKSAEDGGSYFQNILEISKANIEYLQSLDGQPVDKDQWITTPQTVNAYYAASFNSINFPIAFLQEPIYDIDASYEEKLGSIGTVIAHEITHAFDSTGAQFDENGNVSNWWTEEDAAAFAALCQDVVMYFSGQEAAPGIAIDPELTLTENIADLGAIACVTEIGMKQESFDFKKMYESYANLWASSSTREYAQYLANIDMHSPSIVRVNRVLQSVDKFYEVYGIEPGDGMYVAPEERAHIW